MDRARLGERMSCDRSLGLSYKYLAETRAPVVTAVDRESPAAKAGVQEGDKILSVDAMSMEEGDVLQVRASR